MIPEFGQCLDQPLDHHHPLGVAKHMKLEWMPVNHPNAGPHASLMDCLGILCADSSVENITQTLPKTGLLTETALPRRNCQSQTARDRS